MSTLHDHDGPDPLAPVRGLAISVLLGLAAWGLLMVFGIAVFK